MTSYSITKNQLNCGAKSRVFRGEITWSLLHLTVVASSKDRHGTRSYRFHKEKDKNTVLVSKLNMVTSLFHLPPSSFSHFWKLNICCEVIWVIFDFDNSPAGLSYTYTHTLHAPHVPRHTEQCKKRLFICQHPHKHTQHPQKHEQIWLNPLLPSSWSGLKAAIEILIPNVDLTSSWSGTSLLLQKQPLNLSVLHVLTPRSLVPVTNQLTWQLTGIETWI